MIRIAIGGPILAALTLASVWAAVRPAQSADLGGKPATLEQIIDLNKAKPLSGCYADISTAGTFLAQGDRLATAALGAGCTTSVAGVIIVGGGFRADFGSFTSGSFYGRVGVKPNLNLDVYGLAEWRAPDFKLANTGALYLGGGVETTLFSNNVSGFVEGTSSVAKMGSATKDDMTVRIGLRYWIQ